MKGPCTTCGKQTTLRCSICKTTLYCGRACQKRDRSAHEPTCCPFCWSVHRRYTAVIEFEDTPEKWAEIKRMCRTCIAGAGIDLLFDVVGLQTFNEALFCLLVERGADMQTRFWNGHTILEYCISFYLYGFGPNNLLAFSWVARYLLKRSPDVTLESAIATGMPEDARSEFEALRAKFLIEAQFLIRLHLIPPLSHIVEGYAFPELKIRPAPVRVGLRTDLTSMVAPLRPDPVESRWQSRHGLIKHGQ